MASDDDCLENILNSIKDRRDRKFVQDRLDELDERASNRKGGTYREALGQAATEMLQEEAERSSVRRRNIRIDAMKYRALQNFVSAGVARDPVKGWHMALEASLVGINTPLFDPKSRHGGQLSAAALGLAAQRSWIGGAVADMARLASKDPRMEGLDSLFYSRKIETQVFIERYELTRGPAGNPGRTNSPQALEIAKILEKWDRARVDALNNEGAWIKDYSGYVTRTFHDPDRLRVAGRPAGLRMMPYKGFTDADRDAWVAKTLPLLNVRRTFGPQAADAQNILMKMYGGLVDGSHLDMTIYSSEPTVANLAAKESAHRVLHFKDAESWLEYNKMFGRFDPTDAWLYNMRTSANHFGLMKLYGSKPRETFGEIVNWAKNSTMGTPAHESVKAWENALDNRFKVVSGEADRPVGNMWSNIVNTVMAVQRMSKLGLTPFAMLSDNATISRELARQGVDFVTRNESFFSGYFQGAQGSEKREVAELLHTGILGRLRQVTARYDISDARHGTLAKLESLFFKISGITAMTENKRADAERIMAYWLGKQRDKAFGDLGYRESTMLQQFGIGQKEWDLLRTVEWNKVGNEVYLTPDIAQRIPDANVQAYLASRSLAPEPMANLTPETQAKMAADRLDRARTDLAMKLWAYYAERGQYAVLEVGAREKAIMYQGTQSGSPVNTALRLLLQFKQFPFTMISKTWGSEVYGGGKGMDRVAGIVELIVTTTLFGMVANALNDVVKGLDPTARYRNKPARAIAAGFIRGGAASIYGDFLLGEWSRHGQSPLEALAGPTLGQVGQAFEIWSDITHLRGADKTAGHALRFARNNLPFGNMIYTKAGIDYLVYYRLMEMINPGYLERMERTMKEKQGQEFWLRPTQVSR